MKIVYKSGKALSLSRLREPASGPGASSRNLGQTFLANSVYKMLSTTSCDPLDGYDRIHPSRILPVDGCRVVTQATVDPLLPERYLKFHGLEQIILVSFTNF